MSFGPGRAALRPGHQLAAPRQGQILDRGLIELRQAAVAPAGIVAAISGPIAGGAEFLEQLGGIELLRGEQRRQQQDGKLRGEAHESFHLMVTRYAVTSWMFFIGINRQQIFMRFQRIVDFNLGRIAFAPEGAGGAVGLSQRDDEIVDAAQVAFALSRRLAA